MSSETPQQGSSHQAWIRWRQVGLVVVGLLIVATILYMARGALFPFVISIVLAELLYPVVVFLEERMPGHERRPGLTRNRLDPPDLRRVRGGHRGRPVPHDSSAVC